MIFKKNKTKTSPTAIISTIQSLWVVEVILKLLGNINFLDLPKLV